MKTNSRTITTITLVVITLLVGIVAVVIAVRLAQNQAPTDTGAATCLTTGSACGSSLATLPACCSGMVCSDTVLGKCISLTDPNNCGGAGIKCSSGLCSSGLCVDTTTDPNNCGGAGIKCATGKTCKNGSCVSATSGSGGNTTGTPPPSGGSATACATDACSNCILTNRTDLLTYYKGQGWDTSCSNQNAIVSNWCSSVDATGCTSIKSSTCSSACSASSGSTTTTGSTTTGSSTTGSTTTGAQASAKSICGGACTKDSDCAVSSGGVGFQPVCRSNKCVNPSCPTDTVTDQRRSKCGFAT